MKRCILFALLLIAGIDIPAQDTDLYRHAIDDVKEMISKGHYDTALQALNKLSENREGDKTEILELKEKISSKQIETLSEAMNSGKGTDNVLYPLYVSSEASSTVLPISSPWKVVSCVEWCSTVFEGGKLTLNVQTNSERSVRKGDIVLQKGSKGRKMYVTVNQSERPAVIKTVHFNTTPRNVSITLENGLTYNSLSNAISIEEGKCDVTVTKNKYYNKTLTFNVTDDEQSEMVVTIPPLKRQFGVMHLDVGSDVAMEPGMKQTLTIVKKSGMQESRVVSLNSYTLNSLDDSDVEYFKLYQGNLVPLEPGTYDITLEASGFYSKTESIVVQEDMDIMLNFSLIAKKGSLTLRNARNGDGTDVVLDGRSIGTVPAKGIPVQVGTHTVEFRKDGYISAEPSYSITVNEGEEWPMDVEMFKYGIYTIKSDPTRSEVIIDGTSRGFTPLTVNITEGEHKIEVTYEGRFKQSRVLQAASEEGADDMFFILPKSDSLYVFTDNPNNSLTMRVRQGKNILLDDVGVPGTVDLPISDKKYTVEIYDIGNKRNTVMNRRGMKRCYVNGHSNNRLKISNYGYKSFKALDVNLYYPFIEMSQNIGNACTYTRLGDVSLFKFKICKGLSSNVLKGVCFMQMSDNNAQIEKEGYKTADFPKLLPAVSCLLINEEFRIGGAAFHCGDISLLTSYAWYPSLSFITSFNHVSGHDIFVGPEFSTRIKAFSVYVRAGASIFKGDANYYLTTQQTSTKEKQEYVKSPMDKTAFVLSIGFNLGGAESKGQNILRLF